MRIIFLLLLSLFCQPLSAAENGEVEDISELALLPVYCKGTQQIRSISNDPKPLSEYVAIYGDAYTHLHHYCWALNIENKLPGIRKEIYKQNSLALILANIQYVLDRSPLSFSLLPEMYIKKAQTLFKMERDVEAVGVLFKLTQIRPRYGPAYAQLGAYYQGIGDKSNAIKSYEQGIINTPKANEVFFIKKIKELDRNYKITPVNSRPRTADVQTGNETRAGNLSSDLPEQIPPPASSVPAMTGQTEKANPYCRFCP